MMTRRNQIAIYLTGAFCASLLMLGGCSGGGGGGSSSLPSQPSQQNPGNPGQGPAQTPPPSTTSAVRIYASNTHNSINVYDEDGHQFANCPFTNLSGVFNIVFDSHNQRLYVTGGPLPVNAFDLNGNPIKTKGSFPGANGVMAFDSNNRHIYTFFSVQPNGTPGTTVFDEEGNPVQFSGLFDLPDPIAVAFDPFTRQFYGLSVDFNSVVVLDEQGNTVKFPNVAICGEGGRAIAFDSHNRRFYMAGDLQFGCEGQAVTVFDEAGNIVTRPGSFLGISDPSAIAFDAHNNRLYFITGGGNIAVYDEEGNQITTSGTFPNADGFGLVAAPQ